MNNSRSVVNEDQAPNIPGPHPKTHLLSFESFGVPFSIEADHPDAISRARDVVNDALAGCVAFTDTLSKPRRCFRIVWTKDAKDWLYVDGIPEAENMLRPVMLEVLTSQIRLTVAEFAPRHVFVHAGVVVINGRTMIFPGNSTDGKTSLVVELIKRGAVYYSDEFAIFDEDGLVHPFPKTLSIRRKVDNRQVEHPPEHFDAVIGVSPVEAHTVVLTQYTSNGVWKPQALSPAQGVFEMIKFTFPIRHDPSFVLDLLKLGTRNASFFKSDRGEATEVADYLFRLDSLT